MRYLFRRNRESVTRHPAGPRLLLLLLLLLHLLVAHVVQEVASAAAAAAASRSPFIRRRRAAGATGRRLFLVHGGRQVVGRFAQRGMDRADMLQGLRVEELLQQLGTLWDQR
jgi:hypothetical protein